MDKITEALKKILPENEVSEVANAINEMLEAKTKELEKDFEAKLEEAYTELSGELKNAEKTAESGYQEAYAIIAELRTRLETQGEEYQEQLEEGYAEALEMLNKVKEEKEKLSEQYYEEYDGKLAEMKTYIVDKVDQFLQYKGSQFYEQAKRDVINDPRMAEHKQALEKIAEVTAQYMSQEDIGHVSSSKLEETNKALETLKGNLRTLEQRNIRLSNENTKLNENLRQAADMINESKKVAATTKKEEVVLEQKERIQQAKSVTGRGSVVGNEKVEVIKENVTTNDSQISEMQKLAGITR